MTFDIKKIFFPSVGVDIVFGMDSLAPYSRSSIIYDVDFNDKTIIIAQPLTPFSKNTVFKQLHVTSIIYYKNRKLRAGLNCIKFKIIDKYMLANKTTVPAVALQYELPVNEANIRSAFRLPLSTNYIIKGKVIHEDLEYYTPRDFSIRDISLTGLGLAIPKKRNKHTNPLIKLNSDDKIALGIILINMEKDKPIGTIPIRAKVMRVNTNYSDTHVLIGLKILKIESQTETILNKFIHAAQIDELKRLSGRNL